MKLSDMLTGTEVLRVEGSLDIDIKGIHYDSRQVTPGSLFFCIEGYRADGHDFAVMAAEKGAACTAQDVQLRTDHQGIHENTEKQWVSYPLLFMETL